MRKEIVFSLNPVVNLILHILCCADPTFPRKPVYEKKAGVWLLNGERKFFEENFRLEQTGKVSTTAHFATLYQVPAYFASSDIESLNEVIGLMVKGGLEGLKKRFPKKGAMIEAYMPKRFQKMIFDGPIRSEKPDVILRYRDILEEVYQRFYRDHWATITTKMEERARLLMDRYIEDHDVIGLWEEETQLVFPYPEFVVELADPIKTLGTSLMAERDAFSSWVSPEKTFGIISHEVGSHILVQTRTLEEDHLAAAFEKETEKTLRIVEAIAYLLNHEIWRDTKKQLGYSKFGEALRREIEGLQANWRDWRKGRLSITDLILVAFRKLYGTGTS